MLKHTADYTALIDKYMVRHLIKPGITGWAQIQGYRGSTSELWQMEKRVECDVWYMENWYFMLDMKIIAVTIVQLFKKDQNAY
jgi:putative colanic acid biosynthesis UDP-glucose lipid carrier transferase